MLLEKGHEAIDLRSLGLLGASDADLAERAIEADAVLLTTDRDFFHTLPNLYPQHSGVVVIALSQPSRVLISGRLSWFLDNVPERHWKNRVFQLRDKAWLARPPID